jgi:hypothetical protein
MGNKRKEDTGCPFTGISAFHTQLVNDSVWVVFHLLPVGANLASVLPKVC